MDGEVPSWLTKEFVKLALEDGKNVTKEGAITIDNLKIEKPLAKGENFVCEIYRVDTTYKKSNLDSSRISLIIKTPLTGGYHDILEKLGVLKKENTMYNEYLPKVGRLLKGENITPRSYFASQENVIVLEDLKFKGYVMADRRQQLDYDHSCIVLKTLAVFHAASVKLYEDDPELVKEVGREVFYSDTAKQFNEGYSKMAFSLMANECKRKPELNRFADQFLAYSETAWDILTKLMTPKENEFNVLNHGDFWVNNMLFRYENNKPVDLKIIDLQLSRYTWPSIDLMYFLYSSVQEEVRDHRYDDLMTVYLNELNSNLDRFGTTQRLSQPVLKKMMEASDFFGLLVSITVFPIVIDDGKGEILDIKDVNEESFADLDKNPFKRYYQSERFLNAIAKRLLKFESDGWF